MQGKQSWKAALTKAPVTVSSEYICELNLLLPNTKANSREHCLPATETTLRIELEMQNLFILEVSTRHYKVKEHSWQ